MGRFPLSADRAQVVLPKVLPPNRDPFGVFFSLRRGDVVVFQNVEKRETGYGIQAESVLRILNREGPPG
jgi:hypothetical protein